MAQPAGPANSGPTRGIDVSHHDGTIDWTKVRLSGIRFAFMKATESTDFVDSQFQANYTNSLRNGVIRAAYHFGHPDTPAGPQVDFFLAHGGDQRPGPFTLPGMLDMEYNPFDNGENDCWNQTPAQMVAWAQTFVNDYKAKTGRYPILYTSAAWWNMCTGGSSALNHETPLFLVDLTDPVVLPDGFSDWAFRQYSWTGTTPGIDHDGAGDLDVWHGSYASLFLLALKPF